MTWNPIRRFSQLLPTAAFILFAQIVSAQVDLDYERALKAYNEKAIDEAYIHLKNALAKDASNLSAQLLMANVLYVRGEFEEAISLFSEAEIQGADPNLFVVPMGKALLADRQFEQVVALSQRQLDATNRFEWLLLQASAYEMLEQFQQAEKAYLGADETKIDPLRATTSLAHFYLRTGDLEQAKASLEKIKQQAANLEELAHLEGRLAYAEGRFEAAIVFLQKALDGQPQNPIYQRALASALISAGQFGKAQGIIDDILKQTPGSTSAQLLKGALLANQQQSEQATEVFTSLSEYLSLVPLEIKMSNKELRFASALSAYMSGKYEQSRQELESIVNSFPDYITGLALLADTYVKLGDESKALDLLDKRQHRFKDNVSLNLLLCQLFINRSRVHRCDTLLQLLVDRVGTSPAISLMQVSVLSARNRHLEALDVFEKAFPEPMTSEALLGRKVALLLNLGRDEEALEATNKLIAQMPTEQRLLMRKAQLLTRLARFDEAEKVLNQAAELSADDTDVKINLSRLWLAQNKSARAEATLRQLLDSVQADTVSILLAQALLQQQRYDEAEELLVVRAQTSARAADLLIRAYREQEKLDDALNLIDNQLRLRRLSPRYIEMRAALLLDKKDLQGAARELAKLYTIWTNDADSLTRLAGLQQKANATDAAVLSYERALELDEAAARARVSLARLQIERGELDAARQHLAVMHDQLPNHPTTLVLSGELLQATGDIQAANQAYQRAFDTDPNFGLAAAKLYQHAVSGVNGKIFEQLIKTHLSVDPYAQFQRNLLADYQLLQGHLDEAKEHYEALLAQDVQNNRTVIMNNLASILIEQEGDLDTAEQLVNSVLASQPANAVFLDTKGWLLAKQKQYERALPLLRQAFARNTSDPGVRYHLAYTLSNLGLENEAKAEIERALEAGQSFLGIDQAKQLCNQLQCNAKG